MATNPRDITFSGSYFSVGSANFDYEAVDSIRFEHTAIKMMAAGVVHQGTVHHPELDIYIRNHKVPVKVRLPWKFAASPLTHTKQKSDKLVAIYDEISWKTFPTRAQRQLNRIDREGYFAYDLKKFMKDGRIFSNEDRFLFALSDVKLLRYPFYIRCEGQGNLLEKATRVLTGSYVIKTLYDRDVFFYLLDQMYKIRWPQQNGLGNGKNDSMRKM